MQRFRLIVLEKIQHLTDDQLNLVPENASNNIIWNLAHMNTTIYNLCYRDSGLPIPVADEFYRPFLVGTAPEAPVESKLIDQIKRQFAELVPILSQQLDDEHFKTYKTPEKIETAFGISLKSVPDAVEYILHHEGIHYQAITRLLKQIQQ